MMRIVLSLALALALGLAPVAMAADQPPKATADAYPPDAVKDLYAGCSKAKDVPADKVKPVCTCYTALLPANVPYSTFAKANSQLKAKGFAGLDADGKAALEKNGYVVDYCRLKNDAAGTMEERGTFPAPALPALHESCMSFEDVATGKKEAFCHCYEELIRTKLSYRDWRLLSLALATKGTSHLDREEANIFDFVRSVRLGCGGAPAK